MDVIFEALGLTGIESVRRRSDLRQVITRVRETLYPLRLHESSEAAIVLFAIAVAEARLADVSWLAMVRMISRIYDVPLLDRSQPEPDPASPPAGKAKLPCPADLAIETIRVLRADEAINPGDPDNVLDDVIAWNGFLNAIKPRLNALVAEETTLKAAAIAALQAL